MNRRRLLAGAVGIAVTTLAGCSGSNDGEPEGSDDTGQAESDGAEIEISDLRVSEMGLEGIDLSPTFQLTNQTAEAQEAVITVAFGSETQEITEAMAGEDSRRLEVPVPTDGFSSGRYELTVESGGTVLSQEIELKRGEKSGIHGLIDPAVETEPSAWRIEGHSFDEETETVHLNRGNFESGAHYFQLDHPSEFETDNEREPPYEVSLSFQKGSQRGPPVFNGVPFGYGLDDQAMITEDVAVIGEYELPEAHRVDVQVVGSSGDPVSHSEHVWVRLPNGTGFSGLETNADGYVKHESRSESGIELAGPVTIEYLVDGNRDQRTTVDITVTEPAEHTLTVDEL